MAYDLHFSGYMKSPVFKTIVWAVDTMEPIEFQENAQKVIGSLNRGTDADIFPVHVLSMPFGKPDERDAPYNYEQAYLALSEKRFKELSEKPHAPKMHEGKNLVDYKCTTRSAVQILLDYARGKAADVIVVSTHSRGAISSFLLGSFAETLLLRSDIPVMTVNPQTKVRAKISNVLFPTSFQKRFRAGFENAVRLCSALGADLTAFRKEPFLPMIKPSPEFLKFLDEETLAREHEINRCREWAKEHHVKLDIRLHTLPGDVAGSIQDFASDHHFDLIAMVSQTSEQEGPRAGSVCRKIVRNVPVPVWTFKTDNPLEAH